jgi:hypothetical protein
MRQGRTVLLTGLALLAVLPAAAHARTIRLHEAPIETSGAVVVSWHGDPARGCAAVGMCDTRGTITWDPADRGTLTLRRSGTGWRLDEEPEASLEGPGHTIARTTRADRGTCVDSLPADFAGLGLNGNVLTLGQSFFGTSDLLSGGRCAGPRAADLKGLLPSATVDRSKLGTGQTLDFASRRAFSAGALSGELVSTVRVLMGRPRLGNSYESSGSDRSVAPDGGTARPVYYEQLALTYRLEKVAGTVSAVFDGLPDPGCGPLDACGLHGTVEHAVSGGTGRLEVFAGRRRPAGTRVTLAGALKAARTGRLPVNAFLTVRGLTARTTEETSRADGDTCRDTVDGLEADLSAGVGRRADRRIELTLTRDRGGFIGGGLDVLRTRCPGPSRSDIFGESSLGVGRIPYAALGTPALRVTLQRTGGFLSSAYVGSRRGGVTVDLRLLRATARLVERPGR